MTLVRVPCSTSNLGPGFDVLGLALGLYLTADVAPADEVSLLREGDDAFRAVTDGDDLYLRALHARRASRGRRGGVRGTVRSEIPTGRGLGSSSVAVVAGVMTADAFDGVAHDPMSVITFATTFEGHPDNVTPATLGGLTAAVIDDARVHALRLSTLPGVRAVVASPEGIFPTALSRAALPREVPHADATRNVGRAVFLSHALAQGHLDDLGWAFRDHLHQPYRARLLPGLDEALTAAREAGAAGQWLSGAGSSSLALVADVGRVAAVRDAMAAAYARCSVTVQMRVLDVDPRGATVAG